MFRNAYYESKTSTVHLWETIKGERFYDRINWVPYVYVPDDENGEVKTIDGNRARRKHFDTYQEYNDFSKNVTGIYENEVAPVIQFLSERYYNIPDDDMDVPNLKVYSIDIEVHSDSGFPKPVDARSPIVLINVREMGKKDGINISWGIKKYTGDNEYEVDFRYCKSESDLMRNFFNWWNENCPDVVTGWNVISDSKMNKLGGFDFPYIIQRSKKIFGERTEEYKKLSPINIVKTWVEKETGVVNVDIAGVGILDYLALYKWYSPENVENYKLDTVSYHELKLGKLDYSEYESLSELFHKNWNKYVDYNVIDNKRIDELEEKLGYILLAQSLSLLCKCPMKNYTSATALIEGLMITHYRRNDLCAPYMAGGNQEWFPAAFVKEPQKGQHRWVVDLDIASSYPTAIITLNMSPETYYGRIIGYEDSNGRMIDTISGRSDMDIVDIAHSETPIAEFVRKREFPKINIVRDTGFNTLEGSNLEKFNKALKKGLICIAPCGSIFVTNKKGHLSKVEQDTFAKRKSVKKKMIGYRKQVEKCEDEKEKQLLSNKAENMFALQWALKIVLNGMFGVTGVPYSRYFNINISEAITSCGRRAILDGQKYVNRFFQEGVWKDTKDFVDIVEKFGSIDFNAEISEDMVAYVDTDSVFIKFGYFMDSVLKDKWDEKFGESETIDLIIQLSKIAENYVNDRAYHETQVGAYNSQMSKEEFSITFKQEIVCKTALFVQKKKYGYHVVNNEGIPKDEIDVTGLEIIRSETPSVFREYLKELLGMILRNSPDSEIVEKYKKYKKECLNAFPEEISENKGIKGISKYIIDGKTIKGTPYHVKAVAAYHLLLSELDLLNKYQMIEEETKNKLVYVKKNPHGINCIMYDRWPKEFFKIGIEPDYNKMIDKFFTKKLEMLLSPMGKEHILHKNMSFDAFFG